MLLSARNIRSTLLILIVTILGAILGSFFSFLLHLGTLLVFGRVTPETYVDVVAELPVAMRLVLPILGGLIVGALAYIAKAPEVYGEGVRRIKEAADRGDGLIRTRVVPVKFAATLATLVTGGSAGREGPMIMMGAGIGSFVGQWGADTKKDRDRLLLVGVAATISATFCTPLAAVVLVVELLRRAIDRWSLLAITAAALSSTAIARYGFGVPGLDLGLIPTAPLRSVADLLWALVFGLLAGSIAVVVVYGIKATRRIFVEVPLPDFLMPALGGLLVGILACFTPFIYESAFFPWLVTASSVPFLVMLMILMLKIAATCITLGSGGSGGIFAPSLMFGAILGMAVISGLAYVGITVPPLYLLVAMAAIFAGITQLPLTAALLLMEASGHLTLLPLLLIGSYTAHMLARLTKTPSLYQESDTQQNR